MMLWKQLVDRLKAGMHGENTPFSRSRLLVHQKPETQADDAAPKPKKTAAERSAHQSIEGFAKPNGHHSC